MKYRIFGLLAAVAIACSLGCAPDLEESGKIGMPGIVNFSEADGAPGFAGPLVGFGGATQPSAMPSLKSAGFATVINLRLASEEGAEIDASRAAAEAAGLNYIHIPFDPKSPNAGVAVEDFLAAAGDKNNQPIYIHCGSATRVGALWMIGRVLEDGLEADVAAQETRAIAKRPEEAIAFSTAYLASRGNRE